MYIISYDIMLHYITSYYTTLYHIVVCINTYIYILYSTPTKTYIELLQQFPKPSPPRHLWSWSSRSSTNDSSLSTWRRNCCRHVQKSGEKPWQNILQDIHVCVVLFIYVYIYIYIYMMCIYIYMYMYMYMYMYVYIYMYIYKAKSLIWRSCRNPQLKLDDSLAWHGRDSPAWSSSAGAEPLWGLPRSSGSMLSQPGKVTPQFSGLPFIGGVCITLYNHIRNRACCISSERFCCSCLDSQCLPHNDGPCHIKVPATKPTHKYMSGSK